MTIARVSLLTTYVLLTCFLVDCASIRKGNLPLPNPWPSETTKQKQTISLIITGEATVNEKPVFVEPEVIQIWQEQIYKAYVDSNLFIDVKVGKANTDLQIEVNVQDIAKGSQAWSLVCCLSFTLIPSKGEDKFVVHTKIKSRDGQTLASFQKNETVSFWIHFIFIFAAPFNWPATVIKETIYDLNRASIIEAHQAGII